MLEYFAGDLPSGLLFPYPCLHTFSYPQNDPYPWKKSWNFGTLFKRLDGINYVSSFVLRMLQIFRIMQCKNNSFNGFNFSNANEYNYLFEFFELFYEHTVNVLKISLIIGK